MSSILSRCLVVLIAVLPLCATHAAAQRVSGRPAQSLSDDRIDRLEAAIRDLQGVVYAEERPGAPIRQGAARPAQPAPPSATNPQDVVRIQQLEQGLAELTGRVEELTFRMDEQQRRIAAIAEALASGEPTGGAEADFALQETPSDLTAGDDPATGLDEQPTVDPDLPSDPDEAYDVAYQALLSGDYEGAETAFEAYLERFPDEARAAEAQYLLGSIYLATDAYAEAANTFIEHVQTYPDDPRGPEVYLGLGTAFQRLERPEEACRIFRAGLAEFPEMGGSVRSRIEAEQRAADCG